VGVAVGVSVGVGDGVGEGVGVAVAVAVGVGVAAAGVGVAVGLLALALPVLPPEPPWLPPPSPPGAEASTAFSFVGVGVAVAAGVAVGVDCSSWAASTSAWFSPRSSIPRPPESWAISSGSRDGPAELVGAAAVGTYGDATYPRHPESRMAAGSATMMDAGRLFSPLTTPRVGMESKESHLDSTRFLTAALPDAARTTDRSRVNESGRPTPWHW